MLLLGGEEEEVEEQPAVEEVEVDGPVEDEHVPTEETEYAVEEAAVKKLRESYKAMYSGLGNVFREFTGFEENLMELRGGLMKTFDSAILGYLQGTDFGSTVAQIFDF